MGTNYGFECDQCDYVTQSEDDHIITNDGEYLCLKCAKKHQPIDRRELEDMEQEYVSLSLAEMTDDITCDINTLQTRSKRLEEIEQEVGQHMAEQWTSIATQQAVEKGFASGKTFEL